MEGTRRTLAAEPMSPAYVSRARRLAYGVLGRHRLLLALSTLVGLAQRARLVPGRFELPRLPLRRRRLAATGDDLWLFTGCVMDAWMRPVHHAAHLVLTAAGVGVALPGAGGDCCGALHVHAGLDDDARQLAARVMASMPGDAPVLVDSAGCGAAMKDYGHLLGTDEAMTFSARVRDINEWLAEHLELLPGGRLEFSVAVQDPCHLRHVQHAHDTVRTVLGRYAELRDLDDEGLCCGAGGAYAVQHPALARAIRDRKVAAIRRTGASVVASANPGCMLHLSGAGLDVRHPIELVADAITKEGRSGR
jgi:glycolate oxidase iron-sulfur subunit